MEDPRRRRCKIARVNEPPYHCFPQTQLAVVFCCFSCTRTSNAFMSAYSIGCASPFTTAWSVQTPRGDPTQLVYHSFFLMRKTIYGERFRTTTSNALRMARYTHMQRVTRRWNIAVFAPVVCSKNLNSISLLQQDQSFRKVQSVKRSNESRGSIWAKRSNVSTGPWRVKRYESRDQRVKTSSIWPLGSLELLTRNLLLGEVNAGYKTSVTMQNYMGTV